MVKIEARDHRMSYVCPESNVSSKNRQIAAVKEAKIVKSERHTAGCCFILQTPVIYSGYIRDGQIGGLSADFLARK